ncbi:hypothetical protein PHYBOEH_009958, partial [Phytophthora boehmeriae]
FGHHFLDFDYADHFDGDVELGISYDLKCHNDGDEHPHCHIGCDEQYLVCGGSKCHRNDNGIDIVDYYDPCCYFDFYVNGDH